MLIELNQMSLLRRHRWFVAAAGITLAFAAVSLTAHKSAALTVFSDLACLAVMLAAAGATLINAVRRPSAERSFWALLTFGFSLWACNQASWTYWEVVLRQPIPDPYFFDIILFFHSVPLIAAAAWRPDIEKREGSVFLHLLNFLMLLAWWIFLYAFIVFPHQYVVMNIDRYDFYYERLYGVENALLVVVLAFAAWTSSAGWRRLYLNLLVPSLVYGISAHFLDEAAVNNTYYSGSLYDVPVIAAAVWMAAAALSAPDWDLNTVEPKLDVRWKRVAPQLAMLAILSLPVLGLWTVLFDKSPLPSRVFRIFAVLAAMLLLAAFVFLRQFIQDQALMGLLGDSRRSYDSQKRLQSHLVQKEKLASLGNLVAGAAREINHPLTAVMNYSEQLWAQGPLTDDQNTLLRKIITHAQRTRDLVASLLSFARQSPAEKTLVDAAVLLSRATQILESRHPGGKIHVALAIAPDFPQVWGNGNQLFQVFVEIVENAMDALEVAGGSLQITALKQGNEAVLQFSDNGPGIREPERVFDPFYTTKPVGKGTGLGLSVVYGLVQDHGGQITCQNNLEGGALFVVRFPAAAAAPAAHVAGAAGA